MKLVVLLALALLIWFWWDSTGVRELAIKAAHQACNNARLQLLDSTVTLRQIRLQRDESGKLKFARLYSFEFSETGIQRNYGYVVTLGKRIFRLQLDLPES